MMNNKNYIKNKDLGIKKGTVVISKYTGREGVVVGYSSVNVFVDFLNEKDCYLKIKKEDFNEVLYVK